MVPDHPPQFVGSGVDQPEHRGATFKPDQADIDVATLTVNDGKAGTHVSRVLIEA